MGKEKKSSLGNDLITSLTEAIAHERGETKLRTNIREIPAAAPQYKKAKIKQIRKDFGLSQSAFAALLNVKEITVSSWEQGTREPKEATNRLLQVIELGGETVIHQLCSVAGGSKRA